MLWLMAVISRENARQNIMHACKIIQLSILNVLSQLFHHHHNRFGFLFSFFVCALILNFPVVIVVVGGVLAFFHNFFLFLSNMLVYFKWLFACIEEMIVILHNHAYNVIIKFLIPWLAS